MKKILLVPDSFKGTMSSTEICTIMERSIKRHYPLADIISLPVADGGEGSVDSFLAASGGGEKVYCTVQGPYMKDVSCYYGIIDEGRTAVIEMAACAGLPIAGENLCVERATTYGVGQLMEHAAQKGCRKIIVGLGGSATNDLGAGAAAALGIRFFDKNDKEFVPVGHTLGQIGRIDTHGLRPYMKDIEIIAMCDIDNPLYGEYGAAYIFGPQKGADPSMVAFLDRQLRLADSVVKRDLGIDVSSVPGAGAAGGMGGGMAAFLNARLEMGIEVVLDTIGFDNLLHKTDLVISGEGTLDNQSLRGKVVIGVARRCRQQGVPLIAVVGDIGDPVDDVYNMGITGIFSINRKAVPFSQAKKRCREDLYLTVDNIIRFIMQWEKKAGN